ncbi:MAG TPA: hypothetical protein VF403_04775, partial [Kofleriaceae bacterium]
SVTQPNMKLTSDGDGDVSGPVELRLIGGKPTYHIKWQLGEIATTTRIEITGQPPNVSTSSSGFEVVKTFHTNATLPASGVDLVADDDSNDPGSKRHVHWSLKAKGLVAIPKIAAVERGTKSRLDGSASTPKGGIRTYHWTLSPGTGCPSGTPASTELDGAIIDVTLLCSMKAALTVSDDKTTATDSAQAVVKARAWKTTPQEIEGPVPIPTTGLVINHQHFGQLLFAIEKADADSHNHVFHQQALATWKDDGYVMKSVADPKSPFDHWWYLSEYKGQYKRRIRLNHELDPLSETGVMNADDHAKDLELIRACAEKHEREHDVQMRKALASGSDPAPKVELLIDAKESQLQEDADKAFRATETEFAGRNFFEAEVHKVLGRNGSGCDKSATIQMNTGAVDPRTKAKVYKKVTFPNVSALGE